MEFNSEQKIDTLELSGQKVWDINHNYKKILNQIEGLSREYAKKLISKYKKVGKSKLKQEIKDSNTSENINLEMFRKEKGIQVWNPVRFYKPKQNNYRVILYV